MAAAAAAAAEAVPPYPMDPESEQVAVIGGGLVGCMMALILARRRDGGRRLNVHLYEKEPDFRAAERRTEASSCVPPPARETKSLREIRWEGLRAQSAAPALWARA